MKQTIIDEYERKLNQIPKANKQLEQEIDRISAQIAIQNNQLHIQSAKIRGLESQMVRLDKALQTRENQLQQLNDSQEKNVVKEKKYFMQIQNYNKKIEGLKHQTHKKQQNIIVLKKQSKNIESTISTLNMQKNKQLQTLNKGQMKINTLTQQLNEIKLKMMNKPIKQEQHFTQDCEKEQKQIAQLFAAVKKQMALIDVLKKQKVHIIASTVFKYCEGQFQKILQMQRQK